MHRLIFLLPLLAPGLPAAAEPAHSHGGMVDAPAARMELGAQAAFDSSGSLWAVHKAGGRIAVSRSADLGCSWSDPVPVTAAPEQTDPGGDARPKIALGPAGEIYVTWTRPLAPPFTGEIRFARSLDGGRSFSAPAVVHRDRREITHRFDSIAINRQGQVVVVWIDKRDAVAAAGSKAAPYRGAAVYFAVSDDRGATFRGDYRIAEHSCECCRIALVCHADGSLTAMWRHIFEPNVRDHAAARIFPDGTADPVRRVSFEDWRIDACPHQGPALAVDSHQRLHAVWFSGAPQQRGVFYGRPGDRGVEGLCGVGGRTAAHADIAVLGERIAIAWKESDGAGTHLRGRLSPDGGEHWQELELATTSGASDHPQVLTYGGQFHVFWNTQQRPLSVTTLPSAAHGSSNGVVQAPRNPQNAVR